MRGRGLPGMILGILLFFLAVGVLVWSIGKLGRSLQSRMTALEGRGWAAGTGDSGSGQPGGTGNSARLESCCRMLEEALSGRNQDPGIGLSDYRFGGEKAEEALGLLAEVEEGTLSTDNWLLYRKLIYCSRMRERGRQLPDYRGLLSEFGGILQRIREECYATLFPDREAIQSYLDWLAALPGELEEMRARLESQEALEGFYSEESISKSRLLCGELGGKEGLLAAELQRKLSECDFLDKKEREELLSQAEGLTDETTVSLEKLAEYLDSLEGAKYSGGLGNYPEGKAYYDYLLECNTGSGMKAEEMYRCLDDAREKIRRTGEGADKEQKINRLNESIKETTDKTQEKKRLVKSVSSMEARGTLEIVPGEWEMLVDQLYKETGRTFPGLGDIRWTVTELPDAFFGRVSKALYRKRGAENTIYISESLSEENKLAAYQVLTHEGFPGHAYSGNVDRQVSWPILDAALAFPGYAEGWAVWAEFAAADWLAEGQAEYREMLRRNLYDEIALSQMDIGIHGLGWSMEDLEAYARQAYGEDAGEIAAPLWNVLSDNPGIYQSYTVGYLQLKELEEKWIAQGMDRETFVGEYQRCGQAPFALAEEWMQRRMGDE